MGKGLGQEESSFPQNGALLRAADELMRAAVSARRPSPRPLSRVLARHPSVRPSATASSARTHLHSRTRGRRTSTKGKSRSAAAAFSPPSAAAGSGCSTSMPSAAVASSADMLRPPAFTFPSRLLCCPHASASPAVVFTTTDTIAAKNRALRRPSHVGSRSVRLIFALGAISVHVRSIRCLMIAS